MCFSQVPASGPRPGSRTPRIGTLVPILLLLDRSADAFLAKRAGADDWLIKPFSPQDLRASVDSIRSGIYRRRIEMLEALRSEANEIR